MAAAPSPGQAAAPVADADGGFGRIESPIVGTFYSASSPEADPFVKDGQRVAVGDTLCIIEAMKIFNEILAEADGVIRKVAVENAEPVEFGQLLFLIES
jgi:acetyl-CoA carboxylase biotin carboxyl carrier protein